VAVTVAVKASPQPRTRQRNARSWAFDAVVAVNSVFYAADIAAAMRELVRVTRPGGRVVVTAWGPPERSEVLTDLLPRVRPLMPPPPPGAPAGGPGALSAFGALAALLTGAGLRVAEEGDPACPMVFPNAEASWRGHASAGPNQAAIGHSAA
jgi:SAM-dependent methyltransferase